ncbi:MAG: hypothetical protein A2017_15160 [Lentisphaerae bacterium GWF2_44_16]|nr:MAG: hypothetical protein A2017_15160 [Lentisphaerae bacterium GWF2_44_16]
MKKGILFIILTLCAPLYILSINVNGGEVKYAFLMIGDGMGVNQRKAAEICRKASADDKEKKLIMESFPSSALTKTDSLSGVTDSAAAGTALACGEKTKNGMLGILPDGKKLESLAEKAKKTGMKTGIITDTPINHATPAAFYAHADARSNYSEITSFMAPSGFDLFIGDNFLLSKGAGVPDASLTEKGYTVIKNIADFQKLKKGASKIIFLQNIPYAIDEHGKRKITLSECLSKSIELLNSPDGFFIMLEGGKIDWACHANDIAAAVKETFEFDDAVRTAYEFYLKHKDETLIVVTADHETGGLSLTPDAKLSETVLLQKSSRADFIKYLNTCKKNKTSFDEALMKIKDTFGLTDIKSPDIERIRQAYNYFIGSSSKDARPAEIKKMYGEKNPVVHVCSEIIDEKAGVKWSTSKHTGTKVKTTAIGKGAENFSGEMDNTEISARMAKVLGLK